MAKHLLTILACGFFVLAVGNVPMAALVVIGGTLAVIVEDRWRQRQALAWCVDRRHPERQVRRAALMRAFKLTWSSEQRQWVKG